MDSSLRMRGGEVEALAPQGCARQRSLSPSSRLNSGESVRAPVAEKDWLGERSTKQDDIMSFVKKKEVEQANESISIDEALLSPRSRKKLLKLPKALKFGTKNSSDKSVSSKSISSAAIQNDSHGDLGEDADSKKKKSFKSKVATTAKAVTSKAAKGARRTVSSPRKEIRKVARLAKKSGQGISSPIQNGTKSAGIPMKALNESGKMENSTNIHDGSFTSDNEPEEYQPNALSSRKLPVPLVRRIANVVEAAPSSESTEKVAARESADPERRLPDSMPSKIIRGATTNMETSWET